MKKKIICLVSAITLSLILFCMPAFAYSQNFSNYFKLDWMAVGSLPQADYYNEVSGNDIYAYSSDSDTPFGEFSYIHVFFDYVGSQSVKAGDRLVCSIQFTISDFSVIENPNPGSTTGSISVRVDSDPYQNCGVCTLVDYGYDRSSYSNNYTFRVDIDYLVPADFDLLHFSFGVNFNGFKPMTSEVLSATLEKIDNFYLGAANSPEAPNYNNPNQEFGSDFDSTEEDVEDFKDSEQAILDETEKGRNEAVQLFNNLTDTVGEVSNSLLAVTYGLNYFIGSSTLLNSILYISLTLGFVLFIFNAAASIFSSYSSSRDRKQSAKERSIVNRARYQFYKSHTKKGGGS